MNEQPECYGRVRPNPKSRDDSPRQGWRPPTPRQHRWLRGCELLAVIGVFCLLMLAGCSTMQPAVADRPSLPMPKLVPPQYPETLPALTRAVYDGTERLTW